MNKLQLTNEEVRGREAKTPFDLETRTLLFAKNIIRLCREIPKDIINCELVEQLIRSAGSVGANYREANESISKRDFLLRMKIARKEAKETTYWLELLQETNGKMAGEIQKLCSETKELRNILSSIINNCE